MKTLAVVFAHNRPHVLWHCLQTLFNHTATLPDEVVIIDDGSTDPLVSSVLDDAARLWSERTSLVILRKPANAGFSDSARIAFARARAKNPEHLYLIEGDYVFAKGGLDAVGDVLTNTEEGRNCFGIAGYDHPDFSRKLHRENNYPAEMAAQVGTDNVNRAALWRPFVAFGQRQAYLIERVSNTCFSSYLNWRHIAHVAGQMPALWDVLTTAADPKPIDGYPASAAFAAARVVDDGMLSNGLNLVWNRWAAHHGIDRDRFACWLNLKPSVANHISGGGMHAGCDELSTDAHSPSWTGAV